VRAKRKRVKRPEITVPGHLASDVFLGANLLNFLSKGGTRAAIALPLHP
jgi:hypothetical protein